MSEMDDTDLNITPEDAVASKVSIPILLSAIGNMLVMILLMLRS